MTTLAHSSPTTPWRQLAALPLAATEQALHEQATRHLLGPLAWQRRKSLELRETLVLARASQRFQVVTIDARAELNILLHLDVTVPVLPPGQAEPSIIRGAVLAISYPEAALYSAQPGTRFVRILRPGHDVFHPYVHPDEQVLCLGTQIPPAFPLKELIYRSYLGLAMVGIHLAPSDGGGVLNPQAANYWVRQPHRIPLMNEPFCKNDPGGVA